jgi:hypothetical protein
MANWQHGEYSSSAAVLNGLVYLGVTAYAKKVVVKNGVRYGRINPKSLEDPDNVEWEAELRGTKKIKLGRFDTKQEAMTAAEVAFKKALKEK